MIHPNPDQEYLCLVVDKASESIKTFYPFNDAPEVRYQNPERYCLAKRVPRIKNPKLQTQITQPEPSPSIQETTRSSASSKKGKAKGSVKFNYASLFKNLQSLMKDVEAITKNTDTAEKLSKQSAYFIFCVVPQSFSDFLIKAEFEPKEKYIPQRLNARTLLYEYYCVTKRLWIETYKSCNFTLLKYTLLARKYFSAHSEINLHDYLKATKEADDTIKGPHINDLWLRMTEKRYNSIAFLAPVQQQQFPDLMQLHAQYCKILASFLSLRAAENTQRFTDIAVKLISSNNQITSFNYTPLTHEDKQPNKKTP